jgi:flavorubredoxin
METRVTEIADGVHQLTTHVAEVDLGFNQYLVVADEPLLFHTGMRMMFPLVRDAVATVVDPSTLRWIGFGHFEADESGSMNEWLAIAPAATVVHGLIGCMVSIGDQADRPPRVLADGEILDVGGHRLRWLDTPHLPHGWDAGVMFDETTGTLFCGDLFTMFGAYAPATIEDPAPAAIDGERADGYSSWSRVPNSGEMLRRLAALAPRVLAPMHWAAYSGDAAASLHALADDLDDFIHGS